MAGRLSRLVGAYQRASSGRPHLRLIRGSRSHIEIAARHYADAHAFASKGEYDKSIGACRACIAAQPDNIAAYEVLAQICTHLQRYDDALEACADALTVKPNSEAISASLNQLLPLVAKSGQPDRVIAILQKCLAASPDRAEVLMLLIEMLLAAQRYVDVVQACQRLLQVDPEFFPAVETIRTLFEDPAAKQALADVAVGAPSALSEEYDWLLAHNVLDALLAVMSKFYARLGIDPQTAPLVQALERSRRALVARRPETGQLPAGSVLILFETAWRQHQAGQTGDALAAFETILNDSTARKKAAINPALKEAIVRSGSILGRHHDVLGDAKSAIAIYRDVLSVEPDSLVARRLIVLLARSGRLAEAAEFAETAIVSRPNLFRRLPPNRHIAALKAELFLDSEGV